MSSARPITVFLTLRFLIIVLATWGSALGGAPAYHARVTFSSESVEIKKDGTATHTIKRRIKIIDEQGKFYGTVNTAETFFEKTRDIKGSVFDGAGNLVIKRDKGDLEKYCGFGEYELYSDICDYYLTLGAGNFPFTIEYEVVEEINSLYAWPGWYPQWFIPVDTTTYTLIISQDLTYRTKITGSIGQPKETVDDGQKTLTWTLYDLPAFEDEPNMPLIALFTPTIEFVVDRYDYGRFPIDCSSWSSASQSIAGVLNEASRLSKAQLAVLSETVISAPTPSIGCSRLHDYLAERSRYVAVSIGVGGWKPHSSDVTFANGYGDCKDLTLMYVSMLRQAGIDANPALVLTRDRGRIDPAFPRLNFNHMILFYVQENDTTWIDPTCFTCQLDDLPSTDEGTLSLAVVPNGGTIVPVPASSAEDNATSRKVLIALNSDLSADVTLNLHATGNPGNTLRYLAGTMTALELAETLKKHQGIVGPGLHIEECRLALDQSGLSEIRLTIRGVVQRFTRQVKDKMYADLSALPIMSQAEQVDLNGRKYPIEFDYPFAIFDSVTLVLPENYKISQIPRDTSVADQFGTFQLSGLSGGGSATLIRHRTLATREVDTTALSYYGEHCLTLRKIAGQSIVIEKR